MTVSSAGARGAAEILGARIRSGGPVSFAEFMAVALGHPEAGYYASEAARIGRAGDFITSPEVSSAFGECLAVQIAEMSSYIGAGRLTLVELGPGPGRMACDILTALGQGAGGGAPPRVRLVLIESSPSLRRAQRERLEGHPALESVVWAESPEEAGRLCGGAVDGVVLSNEFFDALPVHVVVRRGGILHEKRVGLDESAAPEPDRPPIFKEILVPLADPELLDYARRYGAAAEEGQEAELGLEAARWMRRIGRLLRRGFHLAVDYGHEAAELYSPRRGRGTLLAYWRHTATEDVLARCGEQDLTAHVNFTALKDAGSAEGLEPVGLTTQDRFLLALGLAERVIELAAAGDPDVIRKRLAMMTLIHPEGMGRAYRVLVQVKGIPVPALSGLRDPFALTGVRP